MNKSFVESSFPFRKTNRKGASTVYRHLFSRFVEKNILFNHPQAQNLLFTRLVAVIDVGKSFTAFLNGKKNYLPTGTEILLLLVKKNQPQFLLKRRDKDCTILF